MKEIEFGSNFTILRFGPTHSKRLLVLLQNQQDCCVYRLSLKEAIQLKEYLENFIKENTDDGNKE